MDAEVKIIKSKEHLRCELTDEEVKEAGAGLARKYSEITELEESKKSIVSDFKARIDLATAEATILARKIQNGYEFRNVDCEEQWDFDSKEIRTIRLDTGEIYHRRNMTADELQTTLLEHE